MKTLRVIMVTLLAFLLVTPVANATPRYHRYVALGDSYTSGPGILWPRLDRLACYTSTNNYPALLADNLGLRSYTDGSCGGADTTNMLTPQTPPLPFGTHPAQFSFLRPDTDLVTIGIGGNDFGVFGQLTSKCPELRPTDPGGSPCRSFHVVDGVDTMKQKVAMTGDRVRAVLAGVHERSPSAKVLLVGYPRIAPPRGNCPSVLPIADGDLRWLDDVEQALNSALAKAAADDGRTTFVDMYPASLGHDACAGRAAWIQGKDNNLFTAIQYHPFKSGMVGVANQISKVLGVRGGAHERAVPRSVDKAVVGDASTVTLLTRSGHGR
ncbi:SGNH/GDSL hydrolase family protein [Actinosynnema sp. ALI-1.44]|uniref:SGNH/GDSL hydrolase family protein n=1 Tax=Actinosynnema sp. ALI-1.44 TaxID=1933779 RepID=UPI001EDC2A63|nr:SGNH/GDSL hydrolase family protein [Actinosynnema sp. ALI-1.44]